MTELSDIRKCQCKRLAKVTNPHPTVPQARFEYFTEGKEGGRNGLRRRGEEAGREVQQRVSQRREAVAAEVAEGREQEAVESNKVRREIWGEAVPRLR